MAEIEAGYGRLYDAAACDAVVRVFRDKAFTLSEWQANAGRTGSRPSRLAPTNPSQSHRRARIWVADCRMVAAGRSGGLAGGSRTTISLQISGGPQGSRTPDLRRAKAQPTRKTNETQPARSQGHAPPPIVSSVGSVASVAELPQRRGDDATGVGVPRRGVLGLVGVVQGPRRQPLRPEALTDVAPAAHTPGTTLPRTRGAQVRDIGRRWRAARRGGGRAGRGVHGFRFLVDQPGPPCWLTLFGGLRIMLLGASGNGASLHRAVPRPATV